MSLNDRIRADELLAKQKLCETRTQARNLILSRKVLINNEVLEKPGKMLPENTIFSIISMPRYVSRAGEKLEAFLSHFNIHPSEKNALDVGASTGGFTDCLLQHGAISVVCVDVGHGQLHPKLLNDCRVTNLEKINARTLTFKQVGERYFDIIVVDLSFISLKKVLPNLWNFLKPKGILIALIKPQFESTKEEISRWAGVIKDPKIHKRVVDDIVEFGEENLNQSQLIGWIASPIKGGDGNQEFLVGFKK